MNIRHATENDRELLINFTHLMLLEGEKAGYQTNTLPSRKNAELLYEFVIQPAIVAGDPILVAEVDGVPVGANTTCLRRDPFETKEKAAYGSGMYIVPEHRNKGIGTAILRRAKEELRKLGVTLWEEAPFDANIHSNYMLAAVGFKPFMRVYRTEISP